MTRIDPHRWLELSSDGIFSTSEPLLDRQRIGMQSDVANNTAKLRRSNDIGTL